MMSYFIYHSQSAADFFLCKLNDAWAQFWLLKRDISLANWMENKHETH